MAVARLLTAYVVTLMVVRLGDEVANATIATSRRVDRVEVTRLCSIFNTFMSTVMVVTSRIED